jgi:hypothetical protein
MTGGLLSSDTFLPETSTFTVAHAGCKSEHYSANSPSASTPLPSQVPSSVLVLSGRIEHDISENCFNYNTGCSVQLPTLNQQLSRSKHRPRHHGCSAPPVQGCVSLSEAGIAGHAPSAVHRYTAPGLAGWQHNLEAAGSCPPLPRHGQGARSAVLAQRCSPLHGRRWSRYPEWACEDGRQGAGAPPYKPFEGRKSH